MIIIQYIKLKLACSLLWSLMSSVLIGSKAIWQVVLLFHSWALFYCHIMDNGVAFWMQSIYSKHFLLQLGYTAIYTFWVYSYHDPSYRNCPSTCILLLRHLFCAPFFPKYFYFWVLINLKRCILFIGILHTSGTCGMMVIPLVRKCILYSH